MNLQDIGGYELDEAMDNWTDNRVVHRDDVQDLLFFHLYIQKAMSQFGMRYRGHVCRQQSDGCLLTVKAMENSTPLVVFVTSGTTIGSMSKFVDLLLAERLSWRRDKYPWN